jgi:AcrR family transcriptional regulator
MLEVDTEGHGDASGIFTTVVLHRLWLTRRRMSTPGSRRRYDAPVRRERALTTRRAILDAAASEFGRHGYIATSIATLARVAGVAPETVYATFGSKLGLLQALVGRAVGGDDESVSLLDRAWVRELVTEPHPDRRIERLAREGAAILARRSGVDELVAQAAGADPDAAALLDQGRRERWAGQRRLLEIVAGEQGMGGARSLDEASDVLFALGSPEVYRLLVGARGWTDERFADWYAAALRELVASMGVRDDEP